MFISQIPFSLRCLSGSSHQPWWYWASVEGTTPGPLAARCTFFSSQGGFHYSSRGLSLYSWFNSIFWIRCCATHLLSFWISISSFPRLYLVPNLVWLLFGYHFYSYFWFQWFWLPGPTIFTLLLFEGYFVCFFYLFWEFWFLLASETPAAVSSCPKMMV